MGNTSKAQSDVGDAGAEEQPMPVEAVEIERKEAVRLKKITDLIRGTAEAPGGLIHKVLVAEAGLYWSTILALEFLFHHHLSCDKGPPLWANLVFGALFLV